MVVPDESKKAQTLKLIAEKDALERKINDYGKILETNNVGMTGNLVDDNGYPRSDIDVYQVRHARHQIICLQNDLKALIKEIEKGIEEIHADAARQDQGHASSKFAGFSATNEASSGGQELQPFLKVGMISAGSPAEDAVRTSYMELSCTKSGYFEGLMTGDQVVEFGSINCRNFTSLGSIADVVKHRENQRIQLKVKRSGQIVELNLTPASWSGRGLLGCNIVAVDNVER